MAGAARGARDGDGVTIHWLCGHRMTIDEAKAAHAKCVVCGEHRKAGVTVRRPSFTAVGVGARGPLVKRD